MKNKLGNSVGQLKKAFKKFQEILAMAKNDVVRDSAIQRFEFTYELAWKTMKNYLEEKGVKDIYSPKDAIRGAFQVKLIDNDPKWLDMVETRNETAHIYNEEMAEKVYGKLPKYPPLIEKLIKDLG
jgi:nucleotidyltransferase substrate binding protein (TIGR01987 family)